MAALPSDLRSLLERKVIAARDAAEDAAARAKRLQDLEIEWRKRLARTRSTSVLTIPQAAKLRSKL